MKSFNEIYQELKTKYPDISARELMIRVREKYIFENKENDIIRSSI